MISYNYIISSQIHCFDTVSRKSCSINWSESVGACLVKLLKSFLFCPLVCCLVTLSQIAAKNGAKSSNENILVIVNCGSPSFKDIGWTDSVLVKSSFATRTTYGTKSYIHIGIREYNQSHNDLYRSLKKGAKLKKLIF